MFTGGYLVAAKYRGVINIDSIRVFGPDEVGCRDAVAHAKTLKPTGVGTPFIWMVAGNIPPVLAAELMKIEGLR